MFTMPMALIAMSGLSSAVVAIIVLLVVAVLILISNIHIVPQGAAFVLERLGSYNKTWGTGIHMKIPFIDRVAKKVNLDQLRVNGIVGKTSGPRPFNQISKEQFENIYRLGMEV